MGVNATMMGVPALAAHQLFRLRAIIGKESRVWTGVLGFLSGAGGVGISAVIALLLLVNSVSTGLDAELERASIYTLTLAHLPVMILEGAFTALVVLFLQRVRPELLESG